MNVSVTNSVQMASEKTDILSSVMKISCMHHDKLIFLTKKKNPHDREARIKLGKKYPGIYLTEREAHCALLTILGYTSKEMARKIFLSHRTVQYYLQLTKQKLETNSKAELISILLTSDFVTNLTKHTKHMQKQ